MKDSAGKEDFDISALPDLYDPDREWLENAKRAQAALWRGGKAAGDPPLIVHAHLSPEQEAIPSYNNLEIFCDADRMLCEELREACRIANAKSSGIPSIRANLGTGICLACIGLEQEVFPDKMPWLQQHLSKEEAGNLQPDDIRPRGSFARGLEMMKRFRRITGDSPAVYCMDTQGPFDLAHLMIGDEIFYLYYDDPELFEHVMEISLEIGIRTHTWMKEINGERKNEMYHRNKLYADSVGIRICEDTTAIVGPELIEKALEYSQRLARHFGRAWIHYCGRNDHLTAAACQIPEFCGINFGIIPGHEQDHDFDADLSLCRDTGTVYFGNVPMLPGETAANYLRRLHKWATEAVLIPVADAAIGEEFPDHDSILDYWRSI